MFYKIAKSGYQIVKEKPLPLIYEEVRLECGYRLDLMIENKLIIEVKSVESLTDIHLAQVLTYLKIANCKLGLLINFNVLRHKDGVKRIVNGL
jgi:GxxExxY protein